MPLEDPIMSTIYRVWQTFVPQTPNDGIVANACNGFRNCGTCSACLATKQGVVAKRDKHYAQEIMNPSMFAFYEGMRGRY